MDIHNTVYRKHTKFECECDRWRKGLYLLAKPSLPEDTDDISIPELIAIERKLFFSEKAVQAFISKDLLESVTRCNCLNCKPYISEITPQQRDSLLQQIQNSPETTSVIVAILIYIRETRRLYDLSRKAPLINGVDAILRIDTNPGFKENYRQAINLFAPPKLLLGDTTNHYDSGTRLPFLNEKRCGEGTVGKVTMFEIPDEYLDDGVREVASKYIADAGHVMLPDTKLLFARKTIQGARDRSLSKVVDMEREVLQLIASQDEIYKTNIIDLIAFYTFGDEINLVFPYVNGSLEKLLNGDWEPADSVERGQFPNDWISRGMAGVANGLKTIHNPPKQPHQLAGKAKVVGFHFDLKPGNILITAGGVFKISDFGQSLIQLVLIGDTGRGGALYQGGDPIYAPPEELPSRHDINNYFRRSSEHISPLATRTRAAQNPQLFTKEDVPSSSDEQGLLPKDRGSRASLQSVHEQQSLEDLARYDIWSLACVMLETLTYSCLGCSEAVGSFRRERNGPFYTEEAGDCQLNPSAKKQLKALVDKDRVRSRLFWTSALASYMEEITSLLKQMLSIRVATRPSAATLSEKLGFHLEEFETAKTDTDGLFTRLRQYDPPPGYTEMAFDEQGTSFLYMEGVLVSDGGQSAGFAPCRLRIFSRKGEFLISLAVKSAQNIDVIEHVFPLKSSWFIPLYLFYQYEKNTRHEQNTCKIRTAKNNINLKFHFSSAETGLLRFQAVLLQYEVVLNTDSADPVGPREDAQRCRSIDSPVSVEMKLRGSPKQQHKTRGAQIWKPYTAKVVKRHMSRTTVSTNSSDSANPSTRRRLLILLHKAVASERQCSLLQIPLQPRLSAITEGSVGSQGATSVSFAPENPSKYASTFSTVLSPAPGEEDEPGFPLDPANYPSPSFDKPLDLTVDLKLKFPDNSGVKMLRLQVETTNLKNDPPIRWIPKETKDS